MGEYTCGTVIMSCRFFYTAKEAEMSDNITGYNGLTSEEVRILQEKYGKNELVPEKK